MLFSCRSFVNFKHHQENLYFFKIGFSFRIYFLSHCGATTLARMCAVHCGCGVVNAGATPVEAQNQLKHLDPERPKCFQVHVCECETTSFSMKIVLQSVMCQDETIRFVWPLCLKKRALPIQRSSWSSRYICIRRVRRNKNAITNKRTDQIQMSSVHFVPK